MDCTTALMLNVITPTDFLKYIKIGKYLFSVLVSTLSSALCTFLQQLVAQEIQCGAGKGNAGLRIIYLQQFLMRPMTLDLCKVQKQPGICSIPLMMQQTC